MQPLKIAVATRHFAQPLKQSLDTASHIGAKGVRFDVRNELRPSELSDTGRRHFRAQLRERLLTISGFEFPTRRALYDSDSLDARVAGLKAALDFAFQMGVTVVSGRIGRIPDDADSADFKLLCDVLNDVARHSNRAGATFAITPTVDSVATLRVLFERVTEGPLGLNFDPGGLAMNSVQPLEIYQAFYDRVLAVQVRDGLQDLDGTGVEVPVGRGDVVWDELIVMLSEGRFPGWLTVTRTAGDDKVADMARAIRFLNNVASGT
jgi:sugar phosphate isomerase/epimerase